MPDEEKQRRIEEYVARIGKGDLRPAVIEPHERQELLRFIDMRLLALEFGYPVYGEQ